MNVCMSVCVCGGGGGGGGRDRAGWVNITLDFLGSYFLYWYKSVMDLFWKPGPFLR